MQSNETLKPKKAKGRKVPLYLEISHCLVEKIAHKNLQPGDKMPTATTLADELGVNYRTIKSALEVLGQEGVITQTKNGRAVVAKTFQKTNKFVFVRWDANSFCMGVQDGITKFLKEKNLDFTILDLHGSIDSFIEMVHYPPGHIKGFIAMPFEDKNYIQAVKQGLHQGLKFVFVDKVLDGVEVVSVSCDHFSGAYQATKHLIEQHGCPVYYIGPNASTSSCRKRIAGWQEAQVEYDFTRFEDYLFELPSNELELYASRNYGFEEDCKEALELFQTRKEDKYCIFACNDMVARGVYAAAEQLGLRVGQNVFVVGFDDMPFCKTLPVPLSSVKQRCQQVGYEAAQVMNELLNSGNSPVAKSHRVVPVELVIRDSSRRTAAGPS